MVKQGLPFTSPCCVSLVPWLSCVLCDGTQDGLLHDLPQHRGQDGRPVAPQILPWPLQMVPHLPVSRHLGPPQVTRAAGK